MTRRGAGSSQLFLFLFLIKTFIYEYYLIPFYMALIQFDIPYVLNKKLKIYSIDKDFPSRESAVLNILEESLNG